LTAYCACSRWPFLSPHQTFYNTLANAGLGVLNCILDLPICSAIQPGNSSLKKRRVTAFGNSILQLGTVVEVTSALAGLHFDIAHFVDFLLKFTSLVLKLALFEAFIVLLQSIVEYHFIPLCGDLTQP
jgi:hypothetical protein